MYYTKRNMPTKKKHTYTHKKQLLAFVFMLSKVISVWITAKKKFFDCFLWKLALSVRNWNYDKILFGGEAQGDGGGGTLDVKWCAWSNGGRNQSPKKSLYQNVTPNNPMPNLQALKFCRKDCTSFAELHCIVLNTQKMPT